MPRDESHSPPADRLKFSPEARSALRAAITSHPDWKRVSSERAINSAMLRIDDMIALAREFGIDSAAIASSTKSADNSETHKPRPYGKDEFFNLNSRLIDIKIFISDGAYNAAMNILETCANKQDLRMTERQHKAVSGIVTRGEQRQRDASNSSETTTTQAATESHAMNAIPTINPPVSPVVAISADNNPATALANAIAAIAAQSVSLDSVARLIDDKLREAFKGAPVMRLECKAPDGTTREAEGHQHIAFKKLARVAIARQTNGQPVNIWLAGPAGSGKTFAGSQLAKLLGRTYHPQGACLLAHELLGFIDAGGNYHRTPFRDAFENGGIGQLDEIDVYGPEAYMALQSALANGVCAFPDGIVTRHPDAIIIAGANTLGMGATAEYVGRNKVDAAFLSRFVSIVWDYDTALETAISGNEAFARRVIAARERARNHGVKLLITPRDSMAGAALISAGFTPDEAAEMTYLARATPDQRKQIEG